MPNPAESLDARRARQAAARAELAATDPDRPAAHMTPQAITACGLCDDDGYRGNHVCDHRADHAAAAKRGIAKVRAAMTKDHR